MQDRCQEIITQEDQAIVQKVESIEVKFFYEEKIYLKIYSKEPIPLYKIISLLGDFGIKVLENINYQLNQIFINLLHIDTDKELLQRNEKEVTAIIKEALLGNIIPRCKLYRLALIESMDREEILFLRAMIKYLDQLLRDKKESAIIKIFLQHHSLTTLIARLFFEKRSSLKQEIEEAFKTIKNYAEDRVLRIFYHTVLNIQKSNFHLKKEARSFKFDIASFKEYLPEIEPNIEIFVYHRDFLGVHLRVSRISRGGIRWSDREDFREEIKSLMVTQEAKNAIIIPSGGKGGFYIEKSVTTEEFKHYYTLYIDAMLDLIDKNPNEDGDFYFVVAADKGTAHMSDVANEIAIKRGFWLQDAFASGGSQGYNHKELGVTAKGAWRSAARHFVQKGIDIFKESITVVGTGSMRGDVFGNGMLINPNIKLIGAISSKEIFIDPNPDPKKSYEERKRLFQEERGWSEYSRDVISEGGGVFLREEKEIQLSPQIKRVLGIKKDIISGEELVKRVLCAKVGMLYIGGVGTYVKSSEELNINISDKINEGVRVDASDLKAYAVCEGGNLGLTQKARIEYAKNGGHINLDSIDNSAGVNTSDYEVNLKIVLHQAIQKAKIDEEKKTEVLQSLTDEVLEKVFETNYLQPLAITLDAIRSQNSLDEFLKAIEIIEKNNDFFKRSFFDIPKNKDIESVLDSERKLTRPVLGLLLSFAKIFLKQLLLESDHLNQPFFEHYLYKYFPKSLYPFFEQEVLDHPLRKEIKATVMANIIINNAGITFICDYEELGKERFLLKIRSYLLLYTLLSITKIKKELYSKELELKTKLYDMLLEIEDSIHFSLKWIIRNQEEYNLEPFHILNYKNQIHSFLQRSGQKSQDFFYYIDLIKFIIPAIALKELRDYSLDEILKLLMAIIETFKIDTLLQYIYSFNPKDKTGREIKNQLIDLVEHYVTALAKDVVLFTRSNENLLEGFQNYLSSKMIDPKEYQERIEELQSRPQDLMFLTNIVHKLLLEAL